MVFTQLQLRTVTVMDKYLSPTALAHLWARIKATFATKEEAFDGNYNSLTNKPTIPTVPTNISEFNNDSGYLTLDTLPIYNGGVENG